MTFTKRLLFGLVTVGLVLSLLEVALQLLCAVSPAVERVFASPWIRISSSIPDRQLQFRPNPLDPGHDRNGFRNASVPRVADVVALGDSQTYGEGVASAEAWPAQMEALSGRSVYQMAFGGWGPVHSLLLWDEAMAFHPKVVVEALYAGNDVYDAFQLVYYNGQLAELKTSDPVIQKRIAEQERVETFETRVEHMFEALHGTSEEPAVEVAEGSFASFLSAHSRLYGLLRRAFYELATREASDDVAGQESEESAWSDAKQYAQERPSQCQIFDDGRFKTIFTPAYRLAALDSKDARVREGHQIALEAVERMSRLAAEQGVRFVVVLIPTKEFVFRDVVSLAPREYRALVANEGAFWSTTVEFLDQHDIEWLDALPALRRQLQTGAQPYPIDDGHPNRLGQRAIAEAVNERLEGSASKQ